jgi:hypothetical protein
MSVGFCTSVGHPRLVHFAWIGPLGDGSWISIVRWTGALAPQQPEQAAFVVKIRQPVLTVDFSTLRRLVSGTDSHATFRDIRVSTKN